VKQHVAFSFPLAKIDLNFRWGESGDDASISPRCIGLEFTYPTEFDDILNRPPKRTSIGEGFRLVLDEDASIGVRHDEKQRE
jgi:hypothetical protein